jgi:hypothetical protein
MDALPALVGFLAPEASSPQPNSDGVPQPESYGPVAGILARTQVCVIDMADATHRLAERTSDMPLGPFVEELWHRTVGAAYRMSADVATIVLVFPASADVAPRPHVVMPPSPFAHRYTCASSTPANRAAMRAAVLAFILSGAADVGTARVVVSGLEAQPMCLEHDAAGELTWLAYTEHAVAAGAEPDVAVAAWVRAFSAQHTVVMADAPTVLAALLAASPRIAAPRGQLVLMRPRGVPLGVVQPGGAVLTECVPQYINVHAAVHVINALLQPRFVVAAPVVRAPEHCVMLVLLLALCCALPSPWLRAATGIQPALGAVCRAAKNGHLGGVLELDERRVAVRVAGLQQLAAAVDTAPATKSCNAQAARLAHQLARLWLGSGAAPEPSGPAPEQPEHECCLAVRT